MRAFSAALAVTLLLAFTSAGSAQTSAPQSIQSEQEALQELAKDLAEMQAWMQKFAEVQERAVLKAARSMKNGEQQNTPLFTKSDVEFLMSGPDRTTSDSDIAKLEEEIRDFAAQMLKMFASLAEEYKTFTPEERRKLANKLNQKEKALLEEFASIRFEERDGSPQ
ncbi:MAG: hypothetical protein A3I44_04280 [Candidatus Sungbacteria bacterium RIFCSPLOWO2_02_FULL_51_17]|uniref:DUF5667 domain-containing protein n=1 Tax=Candidatus Sungbacteria bacterium RIFCSPHIGHO2_02_FULL_51_29 TaxID=1802273 RepID=A0A1G2KWW6_9BACT|nr:MAG: hypothetical protein A2676_02790 [Candidatus Sungbacteria bacterium RIFCSPHIGHO2_01_FULL_51_22]OHA03684.1 MAG: hypothetical protein A3C16_03550 [Candidatus Sungbacteria bacterium RIFCSPHIGHO2_02_FULL_51_29]OHA07332.1 MAG: hypothetical protein A3B29_02885 [Candidatus Sungbacteria bacterium RIFCSPLOWO2_01_FULL_51_34]OHA11295.1 MAG: hypothetical protein A3I44_04280 [Candidatus Sungbacteria bacterium RIFCSPLOWO2_02_FULL_51_17]